MKNFIKVLVIVGIILTLVGGTIFVISMSANGWDFNSLSTRTVEEKTIDLEDGIDDVNSVKVIAATANVNLTYHDEQRITVECYDVISKKGELLREVTANVVGNELIIKDESKNFQLFSLGFENAAITVKLPRGKVVSAGVEISTGSIKIGEKGEEINFGNLDLETSTGHIKMEANLTCNAVYLTTSTGAVYINGNLNATEIEVEGSTSDLVINGSIVAKEIEIDHSTGDVTCNAFITAEEIYVGTSTGDVELKLLGSQNDYSYTYDIGTGKSNIFPTFGGAKNVHVETGTGDVFIYFEVSPHL
ncbi:MAG: DUF4097 family beta strand repeat protein [Clostridia bacterium]|nr:DUF4097 family beta strand repeat protein [Clostridia bacterium]